MTARPILFSSPMVQGLLAGRKSQTRRMVKPQPYSNCVGITPHGDEFLQVLLDGEGQRFTLGNVNQRIRCPYGTPGSLLWCREAFEVTALGDIFTQITYCADGQVSDFPPMPHDGITKRTGKKPSIHMPRWASRLTLEITEVRLERLQEISEEDAIAEGADIATDESPDDVYEERYGQGYDNGYYPEADHFIGYQHIWKAINGPGSWDANPWVWAISFRVHRCNVDSLRRAA